MSRRHHGVEDGHHQREAPDERHPHRRLPRGGCRGRRRVICIGERYCVIVTAADWCSRSSRPARAPDLSSLDGAAPRCICVAAPSRSSKPDGSLGACKHSLIILSQARKASDRRRQPWSSKCCTATTPIIEVRMMTNPELHLSAPVESCTCHQVQRVPAVKELSQSA